MRTIYIIVVLIVSMLSSCSDDYLILENPNAIDSTTFFEDEADIEAAVIGTYAELRRFPEIFNIYLSEVRSNNVSFGVSNAQRDAVDISTFNVSTTMNTIEDAWKYGYLVIARANKVLEVINELNLPNADLNTRAEGEARFLRAYANYALVRVFGRIPIIDESLSPKEALEVGQSELPEVYTFIEADLKIAIENLLESYPEALGRATKVAAKALLAEVYLTWGSYPLNESAQIDKSITLLEELISGNALTWSGSFADLFTVANDNAFSLFEVQYISGTSGIGATFPSQFLSSNFLEFPFSGGVPQIRPSEELIEIYDMDNDERYHASVDTVYVNNFFMEQRDNYIKKWFETSTIPSLLSRSDWPHNYPIIRPASIYLMHAEALNKKNNGPTAAAITSLNMTRNRAGITGLNPANTTEFLEALKDEYRREFVGEGVYWHFLVRSEMAVNVMNTWFDVTLQDISINTDKLIYPIPFTQMKIKPGLYQQNPGY